MDWVVGLALALSGCATGIAVGYQWWGRQVRSLRREVAMLDQTLAADETARRRPGQPTNVHGLPARVTQGRIKKRR